MQANKRRDTKPEMRIRSALHSRGLRYRCDLRVDVPGVRVRADIVFTKRKVAVFVDGCYWHGCPEHGSLPVSNRDYWSAKIAANRERDQLVERELARAGWRVVRVWEHEPITEAVERIAAVVADRDRGRECG